MEQMPVAWAKGVLIAGLLAIPLVSCSYFKGEQGAPAPAKKTPVAQDGAPEGSAQSPALGRPKPLSPAGGTPAGDTPPSATIRGTGTFINPVPASRVTEVRTKNGEVMLNFVDANVRDVVRSVLGKTLRLNYVLDPKVEGSVTLETTRPIAMADVLPLLEQVLRVHGIAIVEDGGIYKVVPTTEAARGMVPKLRDGTRLRGTAYAVQIVPLKHAAAREMSKILTPMLRKDAILRVDEARNLLIVAGTRAERASVNEMVQIFDVDWFEGMSFALVPLRFSKAKEVVADLDKVFGDTGKGPAAGIVKFISLERMNSVLVVSPNASYLDKSRGWIERFDIGNQSDERRLYVYHVENGRAVDLSDALNKIFTGKSGPQGNRRGGDVAPGLRPGEIRSSSLTERRNTRTGTGGNSGASSSGAAPRSTQGAATPRRPVTRRTTAGPVGGQALFEASEIRIFAVETSNSLVILATPNEYRQVESALRQLDTIPLQVLISATIAEVRLNDDLQYGVQWFFDTGNTEITLSDVASGAVGGAFPGLSVLFASNSNARVVLNALQEVTDVNVVSSPQLMVLDNHSAELQVGDQVPVATQSSVSSIDPEAPIVNSIQFRDTGVVLNVTPRVNAGGLVTLDIEQEVSDVIPTTTSGIDSPTIQQRRIKSSVAVQSGETVALGGLIRNRKTKNRSGVPLLSQIPVLGALFGKTENFDDRTELLILIRPRVVRNLKEAREMTEELRRQIKGITSGKP